MKNLKFLTVLVFSLIMVQCQNEEFQDNPEIDQEIIPEKILNNLQNMGFNTHDNPVTAFKEGYLVEGDIFIPTKEILAATTKQRYVRVMTCNRAKDVRVLSNLGRRWDNQVDTAIRNWNNVNGSFLNLVRVSDRPDITIDSDTENRLSANLAGVGLIPVNGRAGERIIINLDFFDGITELNANVRSTIEHEIGHNIGFAHTNKTKGIAVPGVDQEDDLSLMNGGRAGTVRALSRNDKRALRRLYSSRRNAVCN